MQSSSLAIMIEFPPFRLDTVNQCLWRRRDSGADERILMPLKAYSVLRYLIERAGRLVTQDELLDAVWPDTHIQPEGLKKQILHIRRVLGDSPETPRYIETQPKRGYQFIAPICDSFTADLATPAHERLVGRDQAVTELRDCLLKASRGQRQIVFVTGEPGIGKTALMDELQHQAAIDIPEIRIARGQCIEGYGAKEAYYPMLEALGQLCPSSGATSIVGILAAQAPTWLVQFPALVKRQQREMLQQEILGATRERMLREIGIALDTITAEIPLLLVFEDLQWVDHSTVDLIAALARRRASAKLMLVATYRLAEPVPSNDPFTALKRELLLHKLCRELDLEPLTAAEVAEYLAAGSSPEGPPEGLAELIYRHTEGNPLFMVTALDHLTRRGLVSRENDSWQLRVPLGEVDLGVPESLRQMIEAQIERLSAEEQQALEAASVAGAAFVASVVAGAIDADADPLGDLYDTLARQRRMVRSAGSQQFADGNDSPRYEFVHALYREVLYQRQAPGRRAKLHARIGERLEALYSTNLSEASPELAYHFEQTTDWSRAIKYLRLSAEGAARRHAHPEVAAQLERAFALTRKLPDSQRATCEIEILSSLAQRYLASYDPRTVETFELLAVRAADHGLIDVEVGALVEMANVLSWSNTKRCLEILDRVTTKNARQTDPIARARTRFKVSYWRIWASAWSEEDAAVCREALSEIRKTDDRAVLALYLVDYSNLLYMSSEYRESRSTSLDALAVLAAGSEDNPCITMPQLQIAYIVFCDLMLLGLWGEALRGMDTAIAAMIRSSSDVFASAMHIWQAWLHVHAMDFAGALTMCKAGDAVAPPDERFYLAVAGTAELGLGNHQRALEYLSRARDEMERELVANDWHCRLLVELALTELWLAKGDISQARAQGEQCLQVTLATAERTYQSLAWEANARVALAAGDRTRAQECIARALSTMEGFEVPLAAWRVHATAAELCTLAGNKRSAKHHRELSRATILKLADSLPPEDALRKTFLSASPVATIMGNAVAS